MLDGVIDHEQLKKQRISNQQMFAYLRSKGIYNLGMVKRVYLEAAGSFSIYQNEGEKPGLATFPPDDQRMGNARAVTALRLYQLWLR